MTSYLADAMIYVADFVKENPQYKAVINMSIGGRGYSYSFKDAIDYAFDAGVLLVTSAGNDYKKVISFPAAYNGVVSVAASTPFNKKADFSTSGFWNSVAAPGVRIWSTYPTYFTGSIGYIEMQGTSMASPHVCGAAALLLSEHFDLTPLEVKNQLEQTTRPGFYGSGYSEKLGHGIIDVEALLGDLKPMQYGSLKVETDVVFGRVTVFNEAGNMAYFGATGEEGVYNFYAMLPGIYDVTLSYEGKIHDQKRVTIKANDTEILELNLLMVEEN